MAMLVYRRVMKFIQRSPSIKHRVCYIIRSWENGNCSFDAMDFTVGLDPFGSQVLGVGCVRNGRGGDG